jgi:large subunit ribosomal protein L18
VDQQKAKRRQQLRRRRHVRNRITGTPERPRLSVFRSNKHIYVQLIDDLSGTTLAAVGSRGKEAGIPYGGNRAAAELIGKRIAEAARSKGVTQVAFDRGHYRFHGRVKALAEAARKGGLQF